MKANLAAQRRSSAGFPVVMRKRTLIIISTVMDFMVTQWRSSLDIPGQVPFPG